MSSIKKNLSESFGDIPSGADLSFGIVVSDWNHEITHTLLDGCTTTLLDNEVSSENIKSIHVPGTFELPVGAKMLLESKSYDAIICIGCVIKGETKHDEYINSAVAGGLVNLGILSSKPVIFGVLTPNTEEQAKDRAGGKHGNKGVEAAITALKMASLNKSLKGKKSKIGFS